MNEEQTKDALNTSIPSKKCDAKTGIGKKNKWQNGENINSAEDRRQRLEIFRNFRNFLLLPLFLLIAVLCIKYYAYYFVY